MSIGERKQRRRSRICVFMIVFPIVFLFAPASESAPALSAPGFDNAPQHSRQNQGAADACIRDAAPCDAPSLSASGTPRGAAATVGATFRPSACPRDPVGACMCDSPIAAGIPLVGTAPVCHRLPGAPASEPRRLPVCGCIPSRHNARTAASIRHSPFPGRTVSRFPVSPSGLHQPPRFPYHAAIE